MKLYCRLGQLVCAFIALPVFTYAQSRPFTAVDSALVGRILLAEDRRDSTDVAFIDGARHSDALVRVLVQRALGRIRDPRFVVRDSLPPLAAGRVWPEPAWRLRLRGLAEHRKDCAALRLAISDSAWPMRLHAADLVTAPCATDAVIGATLRGWLDALPANATRRVRGAVAWQAGAHAIIALARLYPGEARQRVAGLASHQQWHVRVYAARAAAVLLDTSRLRVLAHDANDNVKEAAIESLAKITGHADDDIFLSALNAEGAQAVRAAAVALKGSPRADVAAAANAVFERWVKRANASAHDARTALLAAAGRPASDDRPPSMRVELPPRAVALALGANVRLRVTMAPSSGGGSFVVLLRGDIAPMMAARILALVHTGYYTGLGWHRVEPDFVIQGLSPGENEYVGWAQSLRDELGNVHHTRGTVGMSTRGHDTGDAQWFINLKDNLRLDSDYTVFGDVVEGIDVVDGVLEGDMVASIAELPVKQTTRIGQAKIGMDAIHVVAAAALQSLGEYIFSDPLPLPDQPWVITVPDSLDPMWQAVRMKLLHVLNARSGTSMDSVAHFITFYPITVDGHRLREEVEIGRRWRCGNRWAISSEASEYRSTRANGYWARATVGQSVMADPAFCPK